MNTWVPGKFMIAKLWVCVYSSAHDQIASLSLSSKQCETISTGYVIYLFTTNIQLYVYNVHQKPFWSTVKYTQDTKTPLILSPWRGILDAGQVKMLKSVMYFTCFFPLYARHKSTKTNMQEESGCWYFVYPVTYIAIYLGVWILNTCVQNQRTFTFQFHVWTSEGQC